MPDRPDNEAMRQGRDLEEYVARRFSEQTGRRIRRENAILKSAEYPFAHANIDRWIIGENAGLECKTTSVLNLKAFAGGEYPPAYYAQCVHYMAVTGAERWYLAVLVLNSAFHVFTIERNAAEIEALMAQEQQLWSLVQRDVPPPVDGCGATRDALQTVFSDCIPGAAVDLFGREELLAQYDRLREQKRALEAQQAQITNTIMSDLGTAERGSCGRWCVTWKPQTRTSYDMKRLAAEHPEIDPSSYAKTTETRVLRVTAQKEDKP